MMSHEQQERLVVLSEMAQVQRRNTELAMSLYAWSETEDPICPKSLREMCLKHMETSILNLEKINEELLKLL